MIDKLKAARDLVLGALALVAIAIWFKFNPDAREALDRLMEQE